MDIDKEVKRLYNEIPIEEFENGAYDSSVTAPTFLFIPSDNFMKRLILKYVDSTLF